MDYKAKTLEIEEAINNLGKGDFPLTKELIGKINKDRREYFARVNYNLAMFGKSSLSFDDIKYYPIIKV